MKLPTNVALLLNGASGPVLSTEALNGSLHRSRSSHAPPTSQTEVGVIQPIKEDYYKQKALNTKVKT